MHERHPQFTKWPNEQILWYPRFEILDWTLIGSIQNMIFKPPRESQEEIYISFIEWYINRHGPCLLIGNTKYPHVDGLVQEIHDSIASALELCVSCTNLSNMWKFYNPDSTVKCHHVPIYHTPGSSHWHQIKLQVIWTPENVQNNKHTYWWKN